MRRHRLLLVAGVLAMVSAAALPTVLPAILGQRPGAQIRPENCERIRVGMTEAEVEAVLGGPAGNYSGKKTPELDLARDILKSVHDHLPYWPTGLVRAPEAPFVAQLWVGDEIAVLVVFTDDKVSCRDQESVANPVVPWYDRLCRLLPS